MIRVLLGLIFGRVGLAGIRYRGSYRFILFAASSIAVFIAIGCNIIPGIGSTSRILFMGNSMTFINDLPTMFAELSKAGGHKIETQKTASRGGTLSDYNNSTIVMDTLKSSKWDFVIIQEQSQIPSIEKFRTEIMYPAARLLVHQIKNNKSMPMFFVTWAHRDGWQENGLKSYEDMQIQVNQGYLTIAQELNVPVAPVGYAWLKARAQYPELNLWQEDGIHPNEKGTYLAACVFYAAIFRKSPEGLTYVANLPKEMAHQLQVIAADVVLKNQSQWNLL